MEKFNNELILNKWLKFVFSIYNDDINMIKFMMKENNISNNNTINILNNQINLINKRKIFMSNITLSDYENLSIISNLQLNLK